MKTTIMIWSDFACPYCYIGERRLTQALKDLHKENDVEYIYKAYELNPDAPDIVQTTTLERFAADHQMSVPEAEEAIQNISSLGREAGIQMNFADTQYSSTFDAHRLMKLAEAKYDAKTVRALNEALFDAYFVKNLVLGDHTVLNSIAQNVGMKESDILDTLNSDAYADAVRADEEEADERGVEMIPYLVIDNDQALSGSLSVDALKQALSRAGRFDAKPIKGAGCSGSQCSI